MHFSSCFTAVQYLPVSTEIFYVAMIHIVIMLSEGNVIILYLDYYAVCIGWIGQLILRFKSLFQDYQQ